jgi:hypothetical protein
LTMKDLERPDLDEMIEALKKSLINDEKR